MRQFPNSTTMNEMEAVRTFSPGRNEEPLVHANANQPEAILLDGKMGTADVHVLDSLDSKQVFALIYSQYQGLVMSVVLRVIQNYADAEDVTQEIFVRLMKNVGSFQQHRGNFSTWISKIAFNAAIDKIRKKQTRNKYLPTTQLDDIHLCQIPYDQSFEEIVMGNEMRSVLLSLLSGLSADEEMVLRLKYIQGHTQQEIADMMEKPIGTIKNKIFLARNKIRSAFEKQYPELIPYTEAG